MGDLVAVDRVGAAVAGHAAKQRFHLRGRRLGPYGLAAVARDGEHQHASIGAVVDVADRVRSQKFGLCPRGNFLAHSRDQLPGAEKMLASLVVCHAASFSAARRWRKARLEALDHRDERLRNSKAWQRNDALQAIVARLIAPTSEHKRSADGAANHLRAACTAVKRRPLSCAAHARLLCWPLASPCSA
jgi:hypothetical protein